MPASKGPVPRPIPLAAESLAAGPLAEAEAIGRILKDTLLRVVRAPSAPEGGASALSAKLRFSRVLISGILNALKHEDALEAMQRLPGPETLRTFVEAMRRHGVAAARANAALAAIQRFDTLIGEGFGTRRKLNAAICSHAPSMRRRQELKSRQRVFAGMADLHGGEAEAWVATHMLAPDREDPSRLSARILQGFVGLRKLRPDVDAYFDFMPAEEPRGPLSQAAGGLEEFYSNPPAQVEVGEVAGRRVVRLARGKIGKDAVSDMLSLTRIERAIPRFASSPGRLSGSFALIKTPVKVLHLDIVLPGELVHDSPPELFVFAPGPRACTNVNDRLADLDRVDVPEQVEVLASGAARFEVAAVPNYRRMLEMMAVELRHDLDAMRIHRVSVAYPPFGYEFVSTFRLRSEA